MSQEKNSCLPVDQIKSKKTKIVSGEKKDNGGSAYFFSFNLTKFNDAHVGDAHGCGLLGGQQFVGGTRQPISRTNKNEQTHKV
jgi:hypothetical protein